MMPAYAAPTPRPASPACRRRGVRWSPRSAPPCCSRPARRRPRRRRSRNVRCRCSGSRSRPAPRRANSSASCAPATRPISGSASAARSSPASSMSATACASATSSRGSMRATSSSRSRAPRPSLPRRRSASSQAASDLQRYATLKSRGYAAIADFDRKQAANDEAEGRLTRARRALDLARNQLAYAELKSDADGVVTATLAEPGQVVAIGQAVARLAHRGEKEAVVSLPETWLGEAQQAKATVRLWSNGDRRFQARLRELSPQADPATRTFAARFTILDADDSVAFGMTATVIARARARDAGGALAARRRAQSRDRTDGLCRRRHRRAGAAAGHGRLLHRRRGARHRRRQRRRPDRHARRPDARSGPAGPHHRRHRHDNSTDCVGATS